MLQPPQQAMIDVPNCRSFIARSRNVIMCMRSSSFDSHACELLSSEQDK